MYEDNKFKNNSGTYLLKGLFIETNTTDMDQAIYTLKNYDHKGYPSLYLRYMELEDPTEYEFATTYLDGWAHWEKLCQCNWFIPHIARWRLELDLKMKSQAIKKIKEVAKTNSPNMFQANKIIIERAWENKNPKVPAKRGRPSTEEVQGELLRQVEEEKRIEEDFKRVLGE